MLVLAGTGRPAHTGKAIAMIAGIKASMETVKLINGKSAEEIWASVAADVTNRDIIDYEAVLHQEGLPPVALEIEVDLGGGFEGGYEWTRLSAPLEVQNDFRFALHHEGFLDKAGKFLGLEDKIIGFESFDEAFIIKTNDEQKIRAAFSDPNVRSFFQSMQDFNFYIEHHEEDKNRLVLEIDRAITDIPELKAVYEAFHKVLMPLQS